MKKNFSLVLFIILVFIVILLVVIKNNKNYSSISVENPNSIGNNTNNIIQGINISIQDDYVYYSSLDGLFKTKIGSNKKTKLDSGNIINVNVLGKWIYYVKTKSKRTNSGIINYHYLYKMMINGKQKKLIIKDALNVNVIGNKIFYINGYAVTGVDNTNNNKRSLIVSDLNGNNKQTIIEKEVEDMVVNGNYIYYISNSKMFVYDMTKKKTEHLSDEVRWPYILNGENVIFYDKKLEQIKELNFNTKEIEVIVNNVKNLQSLYINNGILYYTNNRDNLFAYDFDESQNYEISKNHERVLFYYDKLYTLSYDNDIKMIINNKS